MNPALADLDLCEMPPASSAKQKRYRVVAHGLRHFCAKLPSLVSNEQWDVRDRSRHSPVEMAAMLRDLARCDLVFRWAGRINIGRFLSLARWMRVPKFIHFWCGSDVLYAKQVKAAAGVDPWIARHIHWAASPVLAEEVRSLGIECEFVQASFVNRVREPKPLPSTFSVLTFLPRADVASLYGWDRVVEVAKALPQVKFVLAGLHPGQSVEAPPNVEIRRWTQDPATLYEQSTVLWRPVRHDAGISFMVLEALAHGRQVLYSYPVSGAVQVSGTEDAQKAILRLKALQESGALPLNKQGMETVARVYSRDVVREELRRRWEQVISS
jgi:hypothetical protein